jgi:hypothetical protein
MPCRQTASPTYQVHSRRNAVEISSPLCKYRIVRFLGCSVYPIGGWCETPPSERADNPHPAQARSLHPYRLAFHVRTCPELTGPNRKCRLVARRPACYRCLDRLRTPVLAPHRSLLAKQRRLAPYQPYTASRLGSPPRASCHPNLASQPLPDDAKELRVRVSARSACARVEHALNAHEFSTKNG